MSSIDPRLEALNTALLYAMDRRRDWVHDYRFSRDLYNLKERRVFSMESYAPPMWARVMDPIVFEFVQYYRPVLFSATPHRNFEGIEGQPFNAALANVQEDYHEWTIRQYDGWHEYRKLAIDSLLSGMSYAWSRVNKNLGCISSERVDPFDIILDPDVDDFKHGRLIMRRHIAPMPEIRRKFPYTTLTMSPNVVADRAETYWFDDERFQRQGMGKNVSHLGCYYEVWSKMGDFSHCSCNSSGLEMNDRGDYWYMVFAPGHNQILEARQGWPSPVLQAEGDFPLTIFGHQWSPDGPYAMCPCKPVFGFEIYLSHAYSWLMQHMRTAALTKVALQRDFFQDAEKGIEALKSNIDFDVLELENMGDARNNEQIVNYIQKPALNPDFFSAIALVSQRRAEILGLTDVLRGRTDVQLRSAQEAFTKDRNARVPIEDMASGFVEFLSMIARKESMLALQHVPSETIRGNGFMFMGMDMFSPLHKLVWDRRPRDPMVMAKEFNVTIAAGTTERPDRQNQIRKATDLVNLTTQLVGSVGPIADPQSAMDVTNMAIRELAIAHDIEERSIPQLRISQVSVANEAQAAQMTGQVQPGAAGPPTGEVPVYDTPAA